MTDIAGRIAGLYRFEELAASGRTSLHKLHPFAKIVVLAFFLLGVLSGRPLDLAYLIPFGFYPLLLGIWAHIPVKMLGQALAVALPFCCLAGLAAIPGHTAAVSLGNWQMSAGVWAWGVLTLRAALCVSAVLALMAVTPWMVLAAQLRRLQVPVVLVSALEMTYRYLVVLAEEAQAMRWAYRLRSADQPLSLNVYGSLAAQLCLRALARAERIYQARLCRGGNLSAGCPEYRPWQWQDFFYIAGIGALLAFCANSGPTQLVIQLMGR